MPSGFRARRRRARRARPSGRRGTAAARPRSERPASGPRVTMSDDRESSTMNARRVGRIVGVEWDDKRRLPSARPSNVTTSSTRAFEAHTDQRLTLHAERAQPVSELVRPAIELAIGQAFVCGRRPPRRPASGGPGPRTGDAGASRRGRPPPCRSTRRGSCACLPRRGSARSMRASSGCATVAAQQGLVVREPPAQRRPVEEIRVVVALDDQVGAAVDRRSPAARSWSTTSAR